MTVIKVADDKQPEEEIRTARAGMLGERDAAYEIDFEFAERKSGPGQRELT